MASFNKSLNKNQQFIIAIKVIKSPTVAYQDDTAQTLTTAPAKKALIDTGASNTCISQECADELALIPIGKISLATASSNCTVNRYKVDFAIPATSITQPVKVEDSKEDFEQITVGEAHWAHTEHKVHSIPSINKDRGFDVILGMDILSKMHITIFNKQIIMSF